MLVHDAFTNIQGKFIQLPQSLACRSPGITAHRYMTSDPSAIWLWARYFSHKSLSATELSRKTRQLLLGRTKAGDINLTKQELLSVMRHYAPMSRSAGTCGSSMPNHCGQVQTLLSLGQGNLIPDSCSKRIQESNRGGRILLILNPVYVRLFEDFRKSEFFPRNNFFFGIPNKLVMKRKVIILKFFK